MTEKVTIKYTNGNIKGENKTTEDDDKAWAKQVGDKYFVISDENSNLYNHLDFIKPTGSNNRKPRKYIKVTEQVFNNYLKFLATNNQYFLNLARRVTNA